MTEYTHPGQAFIQSMIQGSEMKQRAKELAMRQEEVKQRAQDRQRAEAKQTMDSLGEVLWSPRKLRDMTPEQRKSNTQIYNDARTVYYGDPNGGAAPPENFHSYITADMAKMTPLLTSGKITKEEAIGSLLNDYTEDDITEYALIDQGQAALTRIAMSGGKMGGATSNNTAAANGKQPIPGEDVTTSEATINADDINKPVAKNAYEFLDGVFTPYAREKSTEAFSAKLSVYQKDWGDTYRGQDPTKVMNTIKPQLDEIEADAKRDNVELAESWREDTVALLTAPKGMTEAQQINAQNIANDNIQSAIGSVVTHIETYKDNPEILDMQLKTINDNWKYAHPGETPVVDAWKLVLPESITARIEQIKTQTEYSKKKINASIADMRERTKQGWARLGESKRHNLIAEAQGDERIAVSRFAANTRASYAAEQVANMQFDNVQSIDKSIKDYMKQRDEAMTLVDDKWTADKDAQADYNAVIKELQKKKKTLGKGGGKGGNGNKTWLHGVMNSGKVSASDINNFKAAGWDDARIRKYLQSKGVK